jgi:hypothetical protein
MRKRTDKAIPTQAQLAMIAAATGRQHHREAVEWGLAIWEEAGRTLMEMKESSRIPMPRQFPARFKEFLRLVTKGKTDADRTASVRAMLIDEVAGPLRVAGKLRDDDQEVVLGAAANGIKTFEHYGFANAAQWLDLARRYRSWWPRQLTEQRRKAAKSRPRPA